MLKIDEQIGADRGMDCWFIKSMGKGLKFYESEKRRDSAYNFQTYLSHYSLAPKTYHKATAIVGSRVQYCYETEVAVVRPDYVDDYEPIFSQLEHNLESVGIGFYDWIVANVGFIRGNPVVIDCGYPMKRLTLPTLQCILE